MQFFTEGFSFPCPKKSAVTLRLSAFAVVSKQEARSIFKETSGGYPLLERLIEKKLSKTVLKGSQKRSLEFLISNT